jgi:hypothetical protein
MFSKTAPDRLAEIHTELDKEKKAYADALKVRNGDEKAYAHFERAVFLQSFLYAIDKLPYQPVLKQSDGTVWVGWIHQGEFIPHYQETGPVYCKAQLLQVDENNQMVKGD